MTFRAARVIHGSVQYHRNRVVSHSSSTVNNNTMLERFMNDDGTILMMLIVIIYGIYYIFNNYLNSNISITTKKKKENTGKKVENKKNAAMKHQSSITQRGNSSVKQKYDNNDCSILQLGSSNKSKSTNSPILTGSSHNHCNTRTPTATAALAAKNVHRRLSLISALQDPDGVKSNLIHCLHGTQKDTNNSKSDGVTQFNQQEAYIIIQEVDFNEYGYLEINETIE